MTPEEVAEQARRARVVQGWRHTQHTKREAQAIHNWVTLKSDEVPAGYEHMDRACGGKA